MAMVTPDGTSSLRSFVYRVLIVLAVVALALALWSVASVVLLVFGAVLLAILLRSLAGWIGRHTSLPERTALAAAVGLVLAVLGAAVWLAGAQVSSQVGQLAQSLPDAWTAFRGWLQGQPWGQTLIGQLRSVEPGGVAGGVVSRLGDVFASVAGGVTDLILVLFTGLYLALQPELYRDGIVLLFPKAAHGRVRATLDTMGHALRQWLIGQLIAMATVGVLIGLGLWLLGLPSALTLGLIAALLEFIPLVGPIASAVPAVLLAFTQGWSMVLYVVLLYFVVQQIESNLLVPLLQKRMVSLPPALTLVAVVMLGLLFGPPGILFATPLTVVVLVGVKMLYVEDVLGEQTEVPGR